MSAQRGKPLNRGLLLGMAMGVAAVVTRELVRPRGTRASLIDWEAIRRIALEQCREDPSIADRAKVVAEYDRAAAELLPPLLHFTQAELPGRSTGFQVIGRREWIDVNLSSMQRMLAPVERLQDLVPGSILTDLGRGGANQYVGRLLAYLSRRVMGQYDPHLLGREPLVEGELYIVEPNVAAWKSRDNLPEDGLRRWLVLHEMTHAVEFEAHPWLREHMNGAVQNLLEMIPKGRVTAGMVWDMVSRTPEQVRAISAIQATMALLEGYSDLVMEEVGRDLVPDFDHLEKTFSERFDRHSPLEKLIQRLTGLEFKQQQYQKGDAFCRAVNREGGVALLNRAFEGPGLLPSMAEIEDPGRWMRRVKRQ